MREGRPSRTALQVALAIPYLAHQPRLGGLLPPDLVAATEDVLVASGAVGQNRLGRLQQPYYRRFGAIAERLTVPGLTLHLALRKRWVSEEVEDALSAGVRQVLVVGAGLDTLGLRLAPSHPDAEFVEIDHPASQKIKRRALQTLGQTAPNHRLIAADFSRTSLQTVVGELDRWTPGEATAIVAEGLLMYLSDADVASFFDATAQIAGAGSRILFSYLQRTASGRFLLGPFSSFAVLGLRLQGEPWRWGLRSERLPDYLAAHGWRLAEPERYDLRRRYLEPAGLADESLSTVERLAVAVRDSPDQSCSSSRRLSTMPAK